MTSLTGWCRFVARRPASGARRGAPSAANAFARSGRPRRRKRGRGAQNATRMPPFQVRPSSGAHASTVQRPSGRRCGSTSGASFVWRTSARFSTLRNRRSAADAPLDEAAEEHVAGADVAIRIVVERLAAGVVGLDAGTAPSRLPRGVERRGMAGRQRHLAAKPGVDVELRRPREGVRGHQPEPAAPVADEELGPPGADRLRRVDQADRIARARR